MAYFRCMDAWDQIEQMYEMELLLSYRHADCLQIACDIILVYGYILHILDDSHNVDHSELTNNLHIDRITAAVNH